MITQTDRIRAHLKAHGTITPMEALMVYKITRLAARIHELRADGLPIVSRIKKDAMGARYTEYRLRAPVMVSPWAQWAQRPCDYTLAA